MPPDNFSGAASERSSRGSSCLRPAVTIVFLVLSAVGLLVLPGFIGLGFVIAAVVLFGVFAFHYLLWGRVLNMELQDPDVPAEEMHREE